MTFAQKEIHREHARLMRLAFSREARAAARKFNKTSKGRARSKRWEHSRKGKTWRQQFKDSGKRSAVLAKYNHSEKGQACKARYAGSPKCRLTGIRNSVARRARILGAIQGAADVINKIYARAQELRQWFDVVVDHKIPLVKGGAHSPENLQIIYRFENTSKGARLDYTPSVVFL